MTRLCSSVVLAISALIVSTLICDTASAQWRGHYVKRDGLFHVERYHWGNGLTPTGAAVITDIAPMAFAMIPTLVTGGRGLDDDASRRGDSGFNQRSLELPAEYTEQLRRANNLLVATARLVDPSISSGTPAVGVQTPAGPRTDLQQRLRNLGANPW